jgi:hypothetical protein
MDFEDFEVQTEPLLNLSSDYLSTVKVFPYIRALKHDVIVRAQIPFALSHVVLTNACSCQNSIGGFTSCPLLWSNYTNLAGMTVVRFIFELGVRFNIHHVATKFADITASNISQLTASGAPNHAPTTPKPSDARFRHKLCCRTPVGLQVCSTQQHLHHLCLSRRPGSFSCCCGGKSGVSWGKSL